MSTMRTRVWPASRSSADQGEASISRRLRTLRVYSGALALPLAALLTVAGCTKPPAPPVDPPQRVLQTVGVKIGPDGATTAVDGQTVSVSENATDATTETTSYAPQDVARDLPVRIATTYRTEKGTGSDLSELQGFTGRVQIDLTVENLTTTPENLSYDVAGTQRTQPAMVGAPLTVVASTALAATSATNVVTTSEAKDVATTNGLLSQSENGEAVVQWATVLAPPQLGATATLTLVTDATNFQVPTIDLSVQPGLVTDPSVSGVLDSAFSTSPTSELALTRRTIEVVADVNDVLAKASKDISDVRKNLDSTSETLGKRTVEDLRGSTKTVSSSMKSLDGQLAALKGDITSSVRTSQTSVLQSLQKTVSSVDAVLGDTTAAPPVVKVTGKGCSTTVAKPTKEASLYESLQQVSTQLDGYATATDACKEEAQKALTRSVGPEEPDAEKCEDSRSTTCALYATQTGLATTMAKFVADGDLIIAELQPLIDSTDPEGDFTELSAAVDAVGAIVNGEDGLDDTQEETDASLADVTAALDLVTTRTDELAATLAALNTEAAGARREITGRDDGAVREPAPKEEGAEAPEAPEPFAAGSMLAQNEALADELCALDDAPEGVPAETVSRLRSYLVAEGCPKVDAGGNPVDPDPLTAPAGYAAPMQARLIDQASRWSKVVTETEPTNEESTINTALGALRTQIEQTKTTVTAVDTALTTDADKVAKLQEELKALVESRDAVSEQLKSVTDLQEDIRKAFETAADETTKAVEKETEDSIREVGEQAKIDSEAVGEMFDKSAAGLSNVAEQVSKNGTETVEQERRKLESTQRRNTTAGNDEIDQAISSMAGSIAASSRDVKGATSQLQGNLSKVLKDMGTRKVDGSGLLGSMTTSAARVGSADYQLAQASDTANSYAGVRGEDVDSILLRQAQTRQSLEQAATLPPFQLDLPENTESTTVYTFQIGPAR